MQTRHCRQLTAFMIPKTTGQRVSFGIARFSCTKVCLLGGSGIERFFLFP
jgi:hypothetical protein